ncbi:histidine kinase [Halonotius terrestris]|uniref:Histidine kinase n=1 Tax=Halonotius terrestris TaxID=2487750 RepID=A0A8J8PBM4_9EURY|nr:histidine kinase [Halonotius terrestris]TQQ79812.1 histidine kinase [Halonotius terrestris]
MTTDLPDSLSGFIDEVDSPEKTLLLINRTEPQPLVNLLDRAFENQSVRIEERHVPEGDTDQVCLVEDGRVTATTSFTDLSETFLLVNADRYRTGTGRSSTGSFPAVLTGLDDVEFTVRGFPESNKEKLLLIVISRFIEDRALSCGNGVLHSTFQRLSRLDDEYGTRKMYKWLGESDVDTHVYGVRDDPDAVDGLDLTVHAGTTHEYRRSWVVLFTPDAEQGDASGDDIAAVDACNPVALVAMETGKNVWRSMWTYDRERVERIQRYVQKHF